jgi:hypothetical protein
MEVTVFESTFVSCVSDEIWPIEYKADTLGGTCIPISVQMPHTDHFEPIVYGAFDWNTQTIEVTIAGVPWDLWVYDCGMNAALLNATGHIKVMYDERPLMF